jgi:hypothetical protein
LRANETAAFDTPAAAATSEIVGFVAIWSSCLAVQMP